MTYYTVTLTETNSVTPTQKEAGIAAACEQYNADTASTPGFVPLTPETYVNFVMNSAAESYVRQYSVN